MPDFPRTPVWVTAKEHRYVRDGGVITGLARGFAGVNYEEYDFEGGPYLGFPKSHDVYRDGSIVIVIVPAAGHTPGSVIVFVALPDGTRYALVGDLTWQREGIKHSALFRSCGRLRRRRIRRSPHARRSGDRRQPSSWRW